MTALLLASLACAVWVYLLVFRGGFWLAAERDDKPLDAATMPTAWPRVCAIVPARDEAEVIGTTLSSLLEQDYAGEFSVIVVDDHSVDGTAVVARHAAAKLGASPRLVVLTAPDLPPGWTGKLWALGHGVTHASSLPNLPDYLLFTDADIEHSADSVTHLVLHAHREGTVSTSLMAKLHCRTLAERAMMPAFIFFFQMLYPFAWVNSTTRRTAAAAGGCMLVQRTALDAVGGVEAVRHQLIDDCALARVLKQRGPVWLGLTERVRSIRAYTVPDIRRMIVRSAYTQLHHSPRLLALTSAAMLVTYVVPPMLAIFGRGAPQIIGVLAWLQMSLAFQPTLRFYRVSPLWGMALPVIGAAYLGFTLESAYQHSRGRGGEWKGRVHCRKS